MNLPAPTPPRIGLAWLAGLPDAVTAGFFPCLWLAPAGLGPAALKTGLLMMLVVLHATAMTRCLASGWTAPSWRPPIGLL